MINFNRRNTLWLATLGTMMALVIISSSVSAGAQALLLGGFIAALAASIIDFGDGVQFFQSIQQRSVRSRMSPQAREAVSRAQGRAEYQETDLQLIDVGMIATQSGREGMVMRRTRSISKDDDGVRPFATILVPESESGRSVAVRFEIIDQTGQEQYVHEMELYLHDGEMNILTEDHLPLMNNDQIAGMGEWDLRVHIDGVLMGLHNFALTPSEDERRQRLGGRRVEQQHYITGSSSPERSQPDEEDIPLSLEELLRSQQNQQRG
jgi:hypothetical protein